MLAEVGVDGFKIFGGSGGPAQSHLSADHLFEASVHLFLFDKISGVCLIETMLDCFAKLIVTMVKIEGGIDYQLLGIFAFVQSNLVEMRFLFGGEMKLHRGSVDRVALAVNRS